MSGDGNAVSAERPAGLPRRGARDAGTAEATPPQAPFDLATAWSNDAALGSLNGWLDALDAEARLAWALSNTPGRAVLSTSFGAQSAAALHLVTQRAPDVPVVLVDTGYLFPETYRFADELTHRLALNLHVARADDSPGWFEARHGKLWEQGLDGIERYNQLRKVAPMQRALDGLGATLWIAGLRRSQSSSREQRRVLERAGPRWKLHPVIDWTDRDIGAYLKAHGLPWHPLWEQGYVSIGDVHTTRPLSAEVDAEATRFFGLKRECGLHEPVA
ncbi:MAG: phosphoadenylyl-sulfate reductase [Lysobacteraceae bacterium]|jgi:phosphoadenosine phosphosulfate reductase|nr:phosphoadenylyl-sulfate reductase [Xanthomonadaceae bacterium]MCZ8319112.1 phosphoadenylyl-sulfate reductase [Silanimonas sp.]